MSNEELVSSQSICARKERRYKASENNLLSCETALDEGDVRRGTVVDLSSSGIRLLCGGRFEVGQAMSTELTTDRSYGVYRGVIRRVEPWVDGQSILGCSLNDPIPDAVLEDLSSDGVVNRRSDDRITLNKKAKVSWPLHQGEVDVELQDYSSGGMKLVSSFPIPDDVRLRIRIDLDDDSELVVDAKSVWQKKAEDGCVAGVTYTHRDTHDKVARVLGPPVESDDTKSRTQANWVLRGLACTAVAAAIGCALLTLL